MNPADKYSEVDQIIYPAPKQRQLDRLNNSINTLKDLRVYDCIITSTTDAVDEYKCSVYGGGFAQQPTAINVRLFSFGPKERYLVGAPAKAIVNENQIAYALDGRHIFTLSVSSEPEFNRIQGIPCDLNGNTTATIPIYINAVFPPGGDTSAAIALVGSRINWYRYEHPMIGSDDELNYFAVGAALTTGSAVLPPGTGKYKVLMLLNNANEANPSAYNWRYPKFHNAIDTDV